jgi:hypothetical protein
MTDRSNHDFWVTLDDSKAEEWEALLGKDKGRRLPVKSPIPVLAHLPGFSVPQRVYLLALDCMEPDDVQKIAGRLAEKFGMTAEESEREVRAAGIPIREEHTSCVIVHRPQRWF